MILTNDQEYSSSSVSLSLLRRDVTEQTPHGKFPQALQEDSAFKQEESSVLNSTYIFSFSSAVFFLNQAIFKKASFTLTVNNILHMRKLSCKDNVFQLD